MHTKPLIIKNATIYAENGVFANTDLLIQQGVIAELGSHIISKQADIIELNSNNVVIPGMIDMHIHGTCGADVMDASLTALQTISEALPAEGVTGFLATTMSAPLDDINNVLAVTSNFCQQASQGAECLGVHLEGPFISPNKVGAHEVEHVIDADVKLVSSWQQHNCIRCVTLAPEQPNGLALINYLTKQGVLASIGHTDASYQQTMDAIHAGCTHATHLFNAMSAMHHRDPGAVGAILDSSEVCAELIVDGVHVHPRMIKLAYQQKGADGLVLVSDAMRAKCMPPGNYRLGDQQVIVDQQSARLADGTLAGSIVTIQQAVKNMLQMTTCSLTDIIQMTAVNPAKQLNMFSHKGSIAEGKDADLVVLNQQHDVMMTFCAGQLRYRHPSSM